MKVWEEEGISLVESYDDFGIWVYAVFQFAFLMTLVLSFAIIDSIKDFR